LVKEQRVRGSPVVEVSQGHHHKTYTSERIKRNTKIPRSVTGTNKCRQSEPFEELHHYGEYVENTDVRNIGYYAINLDTAAPKPPEILLPPDEATLAEKFIILHQAYCTMAKRA
jgi:hypothetical protein